MARMVAAGVRPPRTPAVTLRGRRAERGAVTAETAAVLPVLVAASLALVWVVAVAVAQVRVVDAAREGVRVAARGDGPGAAAQAARRVAPAGAGVRLDQGGDRLTMTVSVEVDGPGGLFAFLPGVTVRSRAVAVREPT